MKEKKALRYLVLTASIVSVMGGFSHVEAKNDVYVSAYKAKLEAKNNPQQVAIITREDLDRKGARNLGDALVGEQDVQINTDDMGRQTVSIRGAEARHTLFLVDGRRLAGGLSKFAGASDEIYRLGTDSVERVEILRGAASTKYGADAMGGVINIITKIPDAPEARANIEYSNIGTNHKWQYNNTLALATGKVGPFKGEVTFGKSHSQPYLYGDHEDSMQYYGIRYPLNGKAEVDLGKAGSLRYDYSHLKEDLHKSTELTNQYKKNRTGYRNVYASLVANEMSDRTDHSLSWQLKHGKWDTQLRYYQTDMKVDVNFLTLMQIRSLDKNKNLEKIDKNIPQPYFDWYRTKKDVAEGTFKISPNEDHLVNIHYEYMKDYGEGTRVHVPGQEAHMIYRKYMWNQNDPKGFKEVSSVPENLPEGMSAASSQAVPKYINSATITNHSISLSDDWYVSDDITITPAIRVDKNSKFGTHFSPKVGIVYKKSPNLRFKANVGTGFSTPGVAELYHDWEMYEPSLNEHPPFRSGWYFKGNPDLKPEKSINFDLSVEFERGKTTQKVTLFRNDFRDFMQITYAGQMGSPNLAGFTHYDSNTRYFDPYSWNNEYDSWEEYKEAFEAADTLEEKLDIARDLEYVKGILPVDDIYTYSNIARARMQGIEWEVSHEFNEAFTAKFGYTFLDARDRNTGERLEGRGNNMFNLSLQYTDKKHGFRAHFWGNYTMNYLDIRDRYETGKVSYKDGQEYAPTPAYTFDNPDPEGSPIYVFPNENDAKLHIDHKDALRTFTKEKKAKEKNYGIWNLMLEKDLSEEVTVYGGINNIFGAEDEFLNLGGRVYRIGMRAKF